MNKKRAIAAVVVVGLAGVAYLGWQGSFGLGDLANPDAIKQMVANFGVFGPLAVIALMVLAVVMTPIPSAPIAMAAGAVFGQFAGAVYIIIGAELGAIIAFLLARALGRDVARRWFGSGLDRGLLGSQNALMFAVFASRLMPFISFDLMSYAAGLSALKFWRFAIATFAGIIPASLFLTHIGGVLATSDGMSLLWGSLALGGVTGLPLLYLAWRSRKRPRGDQHED
ncbi:hypothetical protein OAN307_c42180 [Octadecabacter antarcticus 307]|uniref:TVP38/TMEM64 family membrane protein n=1 Tax=Octadecabacter antarcticus 307 TaxID=391626 RepID=M9RIF6_9RHOB|nr:TVP38/TMEM64 family protein [Octadecabacter antarcticus]AGI69615.1 hypothetical protein OAN307_c42180 [Octadecabacter antarcticus 307]